MLAYTSFLVAFLCVMDGVLGYGTNESVVHATGKLKIPSEAMNVTLAIFSGRRDPEWVLQPNNQLYQNIRGRLDAARKKRLTYSEENMPARLGYKGFLVGSAMMGKPVLILGPYTIALQKLLLQTMPKEKSLYHFQGRLLKEIEKGEAPVKGRKKRVAPDFNPAPWNAAHKVRLNNCYNYATNQQTDTFAQPGRKSGNPLPDPFNGPQVQQAAESDGLVTLKQQYVPIPGFPFVMIPPEHQNAGHLVALVVSPPQSYINDFHWYRLDSNGWWSHKPGEEEVTSEDYSGQPIKDPRLADHGTFPNYQFVCFMSTTANTNVL
ncbi:hypothetical protein ACROYT_G038579 [Oculina patagonica]